MLTDLDCRNAKASPDGKPFTLWDERGLYLQVTATGARCWRFKGNLKGRPILLSFGQYPEVRLAEARERRDRARRDIRDGKDPRDEKRKADEAVRAALAPAAGDTLKAVALDYLDRRRGQDGKSKRQDQRRLEAYIFGALPERIPDRDRGQMIDPTRPLGEQPLRALRAKDFSAALAKVVAGGHTALAHKIKTLCSSVCKHGIVHGQAVTNVVGDLAGTIRRSDGGHFASLQEPRRIGELLRDADAYDGQPETIYALRLQPYVFLRPGTLRALRWEWVDFDRQEIRVPAGAMKKKRPHVVPLARQAMVLLRELHPLTAHRSPLLFPGIRSADRPISDNTLNAALRRLGYEKGEQTAHGFRSIADTHLHEMGYADGMVKVQMAHLATKDDTDAAYNYAQYLADPDTGRRPRLEMMQAWADYLDKLRRAPGSGSNVVLLAAGETARI